MTLSMLPILTVQGMLITYPLEGLAVVLVLDVGGGRLAGQDSVAGC